MVTSVELFELVTLSSVNTPLELTFTVQPFWKSVSPVTSKVPLIVNVVPLFTVKLPLSVTVCPVSTVTSDAS